MTQLSLDQMLLQLCLSQRDSVIRELLAGNDTQCFTTEQYRQRFCHYWQIQNARGENISAMILTMDLARAHLAGKGKFNPSPVCEVRPKIWALRENQQ